MNLRDIKVNVWYQHTTSMIATYYIFTNIINNTGCYTCIQDNIIYRYESNYRSDDIHYIKKIEDNNLIKNLNSILENQIFK